MDRQTRSQPTTPSSHDRKPPTTPTHSRYSHLKSPHTTPTKLRENQDRFIPARTPRSARIKLDFSDSDQGPLSVSPFASPSPAKNSNDSSFVSSRLFRSARRNLYAQKSPAASASNIQDGGGSSGQAPEVRAYQSLIANELVGANFDHLTDAADENSTSIFHGLATDCQHKNGKGFLKSTLKLKEKLNFL